MAKRAYSAMAKRSAWGQFRAAPTGVQMMGGAAALGIGALVASGLSQPASYAPANQRALLRQYGGASYAQRIRQRVGYTYGALTFSLSMTAGVAIAAFRRGWAIKIANINPMVMLGMGLVGTIGTMMMTRATPMDNPMKYVWWGAFNTCIGLQMVPLGMLGGAIVTQAALITACIVGSLSAVAAASPSDQFLNMGPVLGCGLGVVLAASVGQVFFPASGLLMNISLYGGLGLFGLYTCYDTQKILYHAQMDSHYDPINRQIGIYMDTINIFVRVAQILAMGGRRK